MPFENEGSTSHEVSSLFFEKHQLAIFLSDSLANKLLSILFSQMVQSHFAIAFGNCLYESKYMVLINCSINHVIDQLPENRT